MVAAARVDALVAAFSFNHLAEPVAGFVEARRVVRVGGVIVAGTYADDDDHPVKRIVQAVLAEAGWCAPVWHRELAPTTRLLGTPERCRRCAGEGGLDATVTRREVAFPWLAAEQLVDWRFGMAQHAPFVAGLGAPRRAALHAEAVARLGDHPHLVRAVLVTCAVVS